MWTKAESFILQALLNVITSGARKKTSERFPISVQLADSTEWGMKYQVPVWTMASLLFLADDQRSLELRCWTAD